MKISYATYNLKPLSSLSAQSSSASRQGALLKVQWPDQKTGYSDLHPWPEFGEMGLEQQLEHLRSGKLTPQLEQALWFAKRDAQLRQQKKNIFEANALVKNNFLVPDIHALKEGQLDAAVEDGFTTVKVKMGRDLQQEAVFLGLAASKNLKLRLDFNAVSTQPLFRKFIENLDPQTLARIEYIEDPFPYQESAWREINQTVKLAVDQQIHRVSWHFSANFSGNSPANSPMGVGAGPVRDPKSSPPFSTLIIKPASMDVDAALAKCQKYQLKAVVTSSMGHTVGMMHALHVAMELKKAHGDMMLDAGCMTHKYYQMDAFAAQVDTQGPYILKVPGTGIGFDELLEKQKWQNLKVN